MMDSNCADAPLVSAHEAEEAEQAEIALARSGDADAFEALVRRHSESVYRIVAGHLGSGEAEDACQEVFIQVHRGLAKFEARSRLATWIFRIATHVAWKRLRRRRRRPVTLRLGQDRVLVSLLPGPDASAATSEAQDAFHAAIAELPEDQRAVLVLRGLEGLSFEEVAQVLGIKKPTAESRMARARDRLRGLLGRWLEENMVTATPR
jgi:RNA polymerase sigma-70 factor (ECF subfamily)